MKNLVKDIMSTDLPIAGGIIVGHMATQKLAPMVPYVKDNEKMHPLIPIAVGLGLRKFIGKNAMVKNLGSGMVAYGIANAVGKFVPAMSINGMNEDEINGVLNDVINGVEEQFAEINDETVNDYEDSMNDYNDDDDALNDEHGSEYE